mgnify:CR=1 FL=1
MLGIRGRHGYSNNPEFEGKLSTIGDHQVLRIDDKNNPAFWMEAYFPIDMAGGIMDSLLKHPYDHVAGLLNISREEYETFQKEMGYGA